ncbi:response regulator [Pontibacter sp. 172403-2]|uniref:response regulator n=1 Tax=Pontibacter rufus TaxID=2791028 RepID=UPI0018AFA3C7|nr:response regulator [Pontibacter sp. 172403-2]MBF9251675.1 response regulator [Pontibacter sp. 172403-2]
MEVFIIDDDELSLFLTENMLLLEDETLGIKGFLSGAEALEALSSDGIPDLIFLDLNMPVMDGWGFLDALTPLAPGLRKSCNIYILTSSLAPSDAARITKYPFVAGLIHKPIESDELRTIFSQHRKK